jgi:hypothetical protein
VVTDPLYNAAGVKQVFRPDCFSNNNSTPDNSDLKCVRLWTLRYTFMNDAYSGCHTPSEHLAVDEVTVLFNGRVILKQNAPTKHKCSGIRIYQLYGMSGYTYNNMDIYFRKGRTCVTTDMIAYANAKQHKR